MLCRTIATEAGTANSGKWDVLIVKVTKRFLKVRCWLNRWGLRPALQGHM